MADTNDIQQVDERTVTYENAYSKKLIESKNIIFHGAPGTGKSYLSKCIAANIVSDGFTDNYEQLTDEQKSRIGFVQFHPSYDYTDFVEGLRPVVSNNSVGFERRDGIFKQFVNRARKSYEDSLQVTTSEEAHKWVQDFLENVELGELVFETVKNRKFSIISFDSSIIRIHTPGNLEPERVRLKIDELCKMLMEEKEFSNLEDVTNFFNKRNNAQSHSYYLAIYHEILKYKSQSNNEQTKDNSPKQYVFIIDEINRGEISKIFGELFFAIDPEYRGEKGSVITQYSNMSDNGEEECFYVPPNVYIIGTMNDIDRSVDTFDFAMRRRFRFIELKANDCQEEIFKKLSDSTANEAKQRMKNLNDAISTIDGLDDSYHIGAAYFQKLDRLSTDELWEDYLEPLLREYVQGTDDGIDNLAILKTAYDKEVVERDWE